MSRTNKHIELGKIHQGIIEKEDASKPTKEMWDRHNFSRGKLKHLKNKIIDKQELNLMKEDLL